MRRREGVLQFCDERVNDIALPAVDRSNNALVGLES